MDPAGSFGASEQSYPTDCRTTDESGESLSTGRPPRGLPAPSLVEVLESGLPGTRVGGALGLEQRPGPNKALLVDTLSEALEWLAKKDLQPLPRPRPMSFRALPRWLRWWSRECCSRQAALRSSSPLFRRGSWRVHARWWPRWFLPFSFHSLVPGGVAGRWRWESPTPRPSCCSFMRTN